MRHTMLHVSCTHLELRDFLDLLTSLQRCHRLFGALTELLERQRDVGVSTSSEGRVCRNGRCKFEERKDAECTSTC